MKLTIILDHIASDRAGTEGQVVKLINGLHENHAIELIVLRNSPWIDHARNTLPCKVTISALGGITKPQFFIGLFRLVRHLRRTQPDVVHTFFPISNIVGVICARLAGVRAVISSRRDYGHWITPSYLKATKFANRFLNGIVTNSEQVKEFTIRVEGVHPDKIKVIYNGVDIASLRRSRQAIELKSKLGIPAHNKVIALVANFRPIKRHDTLLKAIHLLRDKYPDISLLFIGVDNEAEPALQGVHELVEQLDLKQKVFYAQATGDIADFLSIMDIGVNCSESEGLSNAIIEYMAAGVPCVVSDGGGNKDLIAENVNGLTFPVGDHMTLSKKLASLLDDDASRRKFVEASLSIVLTEMSLAAMTLRFEQHYLSLSQVA